MIESVKCARLQRLRISGPVPDFKERVRWAKLTESGRLLEYRFSRADAEHDRLLANAGRF